MYDEDEGTTPIGHYCDTIRIIYWRRGEQNHMFVDATMRHVYDRDNEHSSHYQCYGLKEHSHVVSLWDSDVTGYLGASEVLWQFTECFPNVMQDRHTYFTLHDGWHYGAGAFGHEETTIKSLDYRLIKGRISKWAIWHVSGWG